MPKPINQGKIVPVSKLKPWGKNPRSIDAADLERLTRQIADLGLYKPLIVDQDMNVIGGNMRLKALQSLGEKEAWVFVVNCKSDDDRVKIMLSDNDRAGYYVEDQLVALLKKSSKNIDLSDYKVDLGMMTSASEVIASFTQGAGVEANASGSRHDDKDINPRDVADGLECKCPKCGYAFTPE